MHYLFNCMTYAPADLMQHKQILHVERQKELSDNTGVDI